MKTRLLCLLAFAGSLGGCTVSAVAASDDSRPTNECASQADCRAGREFCSAGLCQPLNGQLESLLLEITPAPNGPVPNLSFTMHVDDVPTSGGRIDVPTVLGARISGNLHLPDRIDCYPTLPQKDQPLPTAADGTLPMTITLFPRERPLGVPQQLFSTSTKYQLDSASPTYLSYSFETVVPRGEYDVYMVPPKGQTGCVVPPQLYRRQIITADSTKLDYPASISPELTLHVLWPVSDRTLDGWTADIVEPLDGRTISSTVELGDPVLRNETTLEYLVPLVYSTVTEINPSGGTGAEAAADLLRLRPPPGAPLPTILFDRSALGLISGDAPEIKTFTRYPSPVTVIGQLQRADDGTPLSGEVQLVSMEISGVEPGVFATFETVFKVEPKDRGIFSVELPPGKYGVRAVPDPSRETAEDALSALDTTWEVRGMISPQAGKVLELSSDTRIRGSSSFPAARVTASATPHAVLPFEKAFGEGWAAPRGQSALSDESGQFVLNVDPGRFDISVQVPEELGFGWYVRPGLEVKRETRDLGRLSPPVPSVVDGTATGATTEELVTVTHLLPLASIRAYAYLDESFTYTRDPAAARSVVQVAETRSDENGAFRLLVPSSLAAGK